MAAVRTVLCPVDFSPASRRQLDFAADLCRLLGAKLVIHHNLGAAPPGAAVGWMWSEAHAEVPSEASDEERLQELMAGLPGDVEVEAKITHGLPSAAVVRVGELVGADLVVITTHGAPTEDHSSVTEQVVERARCAVLALHEERGETDPPRLLGDRTAPFPVVVPTDFTRAAAPAVDCALELARHLPLELHLLHVVAPGDGAGTPAEAAILDERRRRLAALVPSELAERAQVHVISGDPGHEIAAAVDRLGASFVVMGEHPKGGWRRWFTHDTSRDVLHETRCPVWYVPV
jgi:nucleotide-binding universal stress UspA family protein